jgi:hypothetical protein
MQPSLGDHILCRARSAPAGLSPRTECLVARCVPREPGTGRPFEAGTGERKMLGARRAPLASKPSLQPGKLAGGVAQATIHVQTIFNAYNRAFAQDHRSPHTSLGRGEPESRGLRLNGLRTEQAPRNYSPVLLNTQIFHGSVKLANFIRTRRLPSNETTCLARTRFGPGGGG